LHESYELRAKLLTLESLTLFCAKDMLKSGEQTMTIYGYARVSTDGQTVAAQNAALTAAGCAKVYGETASGARSDRPQLAKVLRLLKEGDTLIVTRLDRLARSTRDLLNTLHAVAKKGAGFKSLADAWADTTTPHGRLMLTVLGGLAEFERELIRARTGEGRARARAKGIHMGRPSKLNQHQRQEAIERLERGDTLMDIARTYGVSHTTILRLRPFAAVGDV
jgi:DNA invertase Pin-like site-specific DNA recombinase